MIVYTRVFVELFLFKDTAAPVIHTFRNTLSLHGALPIARKDLSAQRGVVYAARAQPIAPFRRGRHRAVAGEGELAHAGALRSLEHDAAHAVRKAGVAHPVEHDLRNAAHPVVVFRRRLVIEGGGQRSEEHTSELQSLMRISYAVFCLKKKKQKIQSQL